MRERPILFSAPMVRAILAGTKTQTRRVVKPRHGGVVIAPGGSDIALEERGEGHIRTNLCPYGQPGDRLWVRETFCPIYPQDPHYNGGRPIEYDYAATYKHGSRLGDLIGVKKIWKPSIHMPRLASRILLEVTAVRVERLLEISPDDAIREGIESWIEAGGEVHSPYPGFDGQYPDKDGKVTVSPARLAFCSLWESINGAGTWAANPWVWVIEFKESRHG